MLFSIAIVILLVVYGSHKANELQKTVDKNVGTEIVINGDTLIVTSYVWWENLYMLNDGTKVSANLLDDLELLPQSIEDGKEENEKTMGN